MNPALRDESPMSIGLFSPGWPPEAIPNGIIPFVEMLADKLKEMGHQVTILSNVMRGEHRTRTSSTSAGRARAGPYLNE